MVTSPALTRGHPVAVAAEAAGVSPTLVVQRLKGWAKVREEGRCRMCQRPSDVRPLSRHHLVPQSWFRAQPRLAPLRHADANIVPLCDPCHRAVEERGSHARVELRHLFGHVEVAFAIQLRGREWLDARYPAGGPNRSAPIRADMLPAPAPRVVHERDCDVAVGCVSSCGVRESRRRSEARRP